MKRRSFGLVLLALITMLFAGCGGGNSVELDDITIMNLPVKTVYFVGESLDVTGICIWAHYSDGLSRDVTSECEYLGFDSSAPMNLQEITVSYTENGITKTCNFNVRINEQNNKILTKIKITKQPTKKEYIVNEDFDKTGLVVTAIYSDETTSDVTELCAFTGFYSYEVNDNVVIEVTYTENGITKSTTFIVKIKAAPRAVKYEKSLWGKWTRIDNGEIYTITAYDITRNSWDEENFDSVQMESENVLLLKSRNEKYRLFRQAGSTTTFTAKVAGFTSSSRRVGRAAGDEGTEQEELSGVTVKRQSEDIESDTDEATTDENGVVEFTDVVAGETQILTVEKEDGTEVTVEVTPQFDGDNCGTIPIVEKGYSFKTTYNIGYNSWENSSNEYCYGNNYETYNLTLNFKNIGDDTCATAVWELFCNDSQLNLSTKTGMLSSIAAGNTKTANLNVSYGTLNEYYKDVDVIVKVTDSKLKKVWLDQITLRFYQLPVAISVHPYSVDGSGNLNGFIICPDGKARYFNTMGDTSILMPYKVNATGDENKYTVVFSATSDTDEMAYGFSAGYKRFGLFEGNPLVMPYDDPNYYNFDDFFKNSSVIDRFAFIDSYEDGNGNDTEDTAKVIEDPYIQTRSYVQYGDIDYFTFDVTNCMYARIDSISIPKAGTSAAGKKVSATIKGSNLKSPLANVNITCSTKSIVSQLNKNVYSDNTMYVDLIIPANAGDFTVTAESEEYSNKDVFKVKEYNVVTGDVVLKDGTTVNPNFHEEREECDSRYDENDHWYELNDEETGKYYNIITVSDLTEQQKTDAVGIIYYNTIGIPLVLGRYLQKDLAWAINGSFGDNASFTDIMCTPSTGRGPLLTTTVFTGDICGADNWEYICSQDPEGTKSPEVNYPLFNFAIKYGETNHLTGTLYEDSWYIPSIEELASVSLNLETINRTLELWGQILDYNYWSSSVMNDYGAWDIWLSMTTNDLGWWYSRYDATHFACCIHEFLEN